MRSCVIVLRSIQQFELPAKYNNKQYNPTNTHILFIFIMAAPIKSRKALFGDPATATPCDEEMLRLVASDVIGEKIFEQEAQNLFKANVDDFLKKVKDMDDEGWMFAPTQAPFNPRKCTL